MVSATHEERIEQSSPADPPVGASRTQKCGDRILLVEDDRPTLRLERVILEEAGYLVQGVGSGEAALELISEDPPALVILDMGLPGMDGFTTCQSTICSRRITLGSSSTSKTQAFLYIIILARAVTRYFKAIG